MAVVIRVVRLWLLVLFVSFLSADLDAFASSPSECTTVRLDHDPHSLQGYPVLEQKGGTCYAHTAAILVDAYRRSQGERFPVRTSSVSAALAERVLWESSQPATRPDIGPLGVSGGQVCNAVNGLIEYGGCFQDELDTIVQGMGPDQATEELTRVYREYRDYLAIYRAMEQSRSFEGDVLHALTGDATYLENNRRRKRNIPEGIGSAFEIEVISRLSGRPIDKVIADKGRKKLVSHLHGCLKTPAFQGAPSLPDLASLEHYLAEKGPYRFLKKLVEHGCKKRPLSPTLRGIRCGSQRVDFKNPSTYPGTLSAIHEILDGTRPQPVGVGIVASILRKGRRFDPKKVPSSRRDLHSVAVVGRRWNAKTRSCQLLLKNSWGKTCNDCAPELSQDNATGSIWMDEKVLVRGITDLHYLYY